MVFVDDSDDDLLIPKPPGEVGRPNRGGYSLYPVLGWPKKKYDKVKDFINDMVEQHMNCELPMTAQRRADVKKVQIEAVAKFGFLKEYSGLWVVDDFIRNHLKYQKGKYNFDFDDSDLDYDCSGSNLDSRSKFAFIFGS
ncbi:hypothetical protein LENED_008673 [Lentinula edodes]|uniref:Uncharacterized protein n=1 Tax=Lentinula edodes TaxID=5353 RepID=A0A1Q3EHU5_LENED|nr:hypothetical protein LENED_008673 [Lentinula edodes]